MILIDKISELKDVIESLDVEKIKDIAEELVNIIRNNGIIYLCGNGGSGATANMFDELILDMNNQLAKLGIEPRIKSFSLNASTVHLAQTINNHHYQMVFGNQLSYKGTKEDALIAISGSGNSQNVVEAIKTADELEMKTIGLTGMGGGKVAQMVEESIVVDSYSMQQIENVHSIILHMILHEVKEILVAD